MGGHWELAGKFSFVLKRPLNIMMTMLILQSYDIRVTVHNIHWTRFQTEPHYILSDGRHWKSEQVDGTSCPWQNIIFTRNHMLPVCTLRCPFSCALFTQTTLQYEHWCRLVSEVSVCGWLKFSTSLLHPDNVQGNLILTSFCITFPELYFVITLVPASVQCVNSVLSSWKHALVLKLRVGFMFLYFLLFSTEGRFNIWCWINTGENVFGTIGCAICMISVDEKTGVECGQVGLYFINVVQVGLSKLVTLQTMRQEKSTKDSEVTQQACEKLHSAGAIPHSSNTPLFVWGSMAAI